MSVLSILLVLLFPLSAMASEASFSVPEPEPFTGADASVQEEEGEPDSFGEDGSSGDAAESETEAEESESAEPDSSGSFVSVPEENEDLDDTESMDEEDSEIPVPFGITPFAILPSSNPINSIFPDPLFAQYIAGQLGKDVTATVTQNELNSIKTVQITGALHSIEGAQYLNGLTEMRIDNCQLSERFPEAFITDVYPKINNYYANNQRYEGPTVYVTGGSLQGAYSQVPPLFWQIFANSGGKQVGTWNIMNQYGGSIASFPAIDGTELLKYQLTTSGTYRVELVLSSPAWMGLDNSIYMFTVEFGGITTGTITGTVTDQNGAPLANVTMTLAPGGVVSTDANGVYTFTNLTPGSYSVTAALAGYGSQTKTGAVTAGNTTVINFRLVQRPGSVVGTVISSLDSQPIANAEVILYRMPGFVSVGTTTTDADGAYYFNAVPVGTYETHASFNGYILGNSILSPVGGNEVTVLDIILTPLPVSVSGFVYDKTTLLPIENAMVSLPSGTHFITGADGAYSFSLSIGTFTLTASCLGYSSEQETVTLVVGQNGEQDFYLTPSPVTVVVNTIDQDGDPLPGVTLASADYTAKTDGTGVYSRPVAPGVYNITGTLEGYTSANQTVTVNAGSPTMYITLQLTKLETSLEGYVYGSADTSVPLSGATVVLASGGSAVTDSTGYYQFFALAPNTYDATASYSGYDPATENNIVIVTGSTIQQDFHLQETTTLPQLNGRVIDISTRLEISGATVAVQPQNATASTDGSGSYSFTTLPAGSYTVAASAQGYQSSTRPNVVLANGKTTVASFYRFPQWGL